MEKNFVLAMALSALIALLYLWSNAAQQQARRAEPPSQVGQPPLDSTTRPAAETVRGKPQPSPDSADPLAPAPRPETPAPPPFPSYPRETHILENDSLVVTVSTVGASVTKVVLPQQREDDRATPLEIISPALNSGRAFTVRPLYHNLPLDTVPWRVTRNDSMEGVVEFELPLPDDRGTIKKTIRLLEDYLLAVTIQWPTGWQVSDNQDPLYYFFGPERIRYDKVSRWPNQRVTAYPDHEGKLATAERSPVEKLPSGETFIDGSDALWSGLESNYFACAIRPLGDTTRLPYPWKVVVDQPSEYSKGNHAGGMQEHAFQVGFRRSIEPGAEHRYEIFLGPKERTVLKQEKFQAIGYDELIDYGRLGWLVRMFLFLLNMFHSVVKNYGLAIICLTILVKTILHPINKRNQSLMQKNQKKLASIQPQMKELREKHKNDPRKMNQEIQKLMQEHGVNPAQMFGGCLMMFLQLPIWIGLFNTFGVAYEIRQAGFLYIDDLTLPDRLFGFPFPFIVSYFNLLPLLYVILTVINQKMMPKSDDPQMQQQQKMMTFMLVAFGFIFYNFSSGLLLYFLTNAGLGIVEQKIIRAELAKTAQ